MNWLTDLKNALRWGKNLSTEIFKSKNISYLGLLAMTMTLAVGLVLFVIDPNIKTPMDGVWSAWVTMTHVGFGDVVPVSFFGRLLAAGLILVGLVLFSLFTALISVTLIDRNLDTLGNSLKLIEFQKAPMLDRDEQIQAEFVKLNQRLANIEALLVAANEQKHSQ